jgi:hypothetical protein
VRAKVSRELVGARKRFGARVPLADVGSLACVHANMRLQVRRLVIAFIAVFVGTYVIPGFSGGRSGGGGDVGATTGRLWR